MTKKNCVDKKCRADLWSNANGTASDFDSRVAGLWAHWSATQTLIVDLLVQDNRSANDRVRAGELQLWRDDLREDLTVDWREDNIAKIALVRSRVIETSVKSVRRVPVWASSFACLIILTDSINQLFNN